MKLALLIFIGIVARAQDGGVASLSSNAKYYTLDKQARVQGEVTVLLSRGAGGAINAAKTGHPLLVAGIEADADHWKEWAAMGIEQVNYMFKIEPAAFVTTKVQVPRNRLVRMIPWARKTKTREYTEQVKTLPVQGRKEIELSGKSLRIVITVDTPGLMTSNSGVRT